MQDARKSPRLVEMSGHLVITRLVRSDPFGGMNRTGNYGTQLGTSVLSDQDDIRLGKTSDGLNYGPRCYQHHVGENPASSSHSSS